MLRESVVSKQTREKKIKLKREREREITKTTQGKEWERDMVCGQASIKVLKVRPIK